jgi:hypothetical protein
LVAIAKLREKQEKLWEAERERRGVEKVGPSELMRNESPSEGLYRPRLLQEEKTK